MSVVAGIAVIFGSVVAMVNAPLVFLPDQAREWIRRFPRAKWTGRVLATVALVWSAILVNQMPMGRFDSWKPFLFVLTPVTVALVVMFMDELLAPRALGGLMTLIPAKILDAARGDDSNWRLVVVVLCYVMIVKGIWLILSPYQFRKQTERFLPDARRCRVWGTIGLSVGLAVVVVGLTVL